MNSFLIAETYVPKHELQRVAQTILQAQKLREDSWNGLRYTRCHNRTSQVACRQIQLDEFWQPIIYAWNRDTWNESQTWAQELVKSKQL